ncbi:hypothetical protein [Konateibacter massiliensis]|uniref:hypothetical protein n=1 Tax=Konateibacter massiliensis TaxID=2002841 RepID=UPI00117A5711|nr:hypothetical protein [Konateibacter massiliensis]
METRVVITDYNKYWRSYKNTVGHHGTIKSEISSAGNYAVKIDDLRNDKFSSATGCFWINKEYLKLESEENNMSKLTGFKAVAVVNQGYKNYHFAIYEDNTEYQVGDRIIVSGSETIHTITEIITPEEAEQRYKGNITAEVIGKVDTSAYEERVAKRKEAEELKKSMDRAIREMDEVNKYEMYANQNPILKEMLDKYKKLVG